MSISHIPILQNMQTGSSGKNYKKYILGFWISYLVLLVLVALFFIAMSYGIFGPMPTFEELENPKSNLATEVISSDGKLLGKYYIENRPTHNTRNFHQILSMLLLQRKTPVLKSIQVSMLRLSSGSSGA